MRAQTAPKKKGLSLWQTFFVHRYCHSSWSLKINYVTQLLAFQRSWPNLWVKQAAVWARSHQGPENLGELASADPQNPKPAFDSQDNAFLSWTHSYAAFHTWSTCWVCGALPSSVEDFPWWVSLLQGKDFLQLCKNLHQQLYVMPLLDLMTSSNAKMDWYNHDVVTFDFKFWI